MFSVKIYKNGTQTNGAEFETKEQALDWLAHGNNQGWWQTEDKVEVIPAKTEMREVEVQPEVRDEDGNVVQERVVEMQEVVVEPEQRIVHPATHTYEIVDITEELNRQKALERRQRLRLAGERLIDEMSVKNSEMGISLAQLKVIMLDEDAVLVRELLWTGSLESAKAVIEEKRGKFEGMMGEEYVGWVLGRIEEMLGSV